MAYRLQRLNNISSRFLTRYYGNVGCRRYSSFSLHWKSLHCVQRKFNEALELRNFNVRSYSTVPRTMHEPLPLNDFMSFIYSALDEHEGPSYRWVNRGEGSKHDLKKDGIFLICVAQFDGGCSVSDGNSLTAFKKVKLLKQRHPSLQVMGFQYHPSILSEVVSTNLIRRVMMDYITFPILFSNTDCFERKDGPCYILFKGGLQSPSIYHDKDVDFGLLEEAAKTLLAENGKGHSLADKLQSSWMNPVHIVKEPCLSSFMRNLFFCFPACISSDEEGNRLFLSDVNHHRIIIFDNNGKILDCIGSSPGFEDSEFENAKLMRPAASFYHALEDSLYFVDSENHAIRKADLERRIVETIYPSNTVKKNSSLWSWILDKLWSKREAEIKSEELNSDSFLFPWHLMKSTNNELFVLSRSLGTLWIIDMASWDMRVVQGLPNILEICGHMMVEKSSLVKHIPNDWLLLLNGVGTRSVNEIPYAKLMSSVAKLKDDAVLCDAGGQMVLKFDTKSGSPANFQFSNLGVLGLPYWLSFPLERVFAVDGIEVPTDHTEHFRLLPGKVKIKLNIDIPEHLVLVEPIEESSVWCQVRGSAIEASSVESRASSSSSSVKVGIAQQWYDEMDSLAFSTPESESRADVDSTASTVEVQEGRICINSMITTSPGTSEAIICAPIYLRLKKSSSSSSECQAKYAKQLVDILVPAKNPGRDYLAKFLVESNKDLEGLVFMKPLHVRLKFDCGMHPKAENSKSVILTDSFVQVDVVLR